MLSVDEQLIDAVSKLPLGSIEYAMSFDGGNTFYSINPTERADNREIGKILTINSGLSLAQRTTSDQPVSSYIDIPYDSMSIILRAVFKRSGSPLNSPRLLKTRIKVMGRDILRRQA